jgi:carboxypeptidase PM20D1
MNKFSTIVGLVTLIAGVASAAPVKVDPKLHAEALNILQKSIAFRTVVGAGQGPAYATFLKDVLVASGYDPADINIDSVEGHSTFVARYPGSDSKKKPMLLIGHMDVVEAKREDWDRDPFVPVIENGFVFGRGAYDNKFDISMMVATLSQLRRSGWKPRRDVVLALSGDEEMYLVSTRKLASQLTNAEFALNGDAGGGLLAEDGNPVFYGIQAGEKTYADFTLTVTNAGGHSSRPNRKNAINQLARALDRIGSFEFPVMSNELTREYFRASTATTPGHAGELIKRYVEDPSDREAIAELSADPEYVGQLRTTCVATQLEGGHAPNALPQRAKATVNCRIFPGTAVADVRASLAKIIDDQDVVIETVDAGSIESPVSPLREDVLKAIRKAVHAQHPGLPIIPAMSAGATDGMHFRALGVPTYGVSGLYIKASDDFSHGLNERIPLAAIDPALAHWNSIIRDLAN